MHVLFFCYNLLFVPYCSMHIYIYIYIQYVPELNKVLPTTPIILVGHLYNSTAKSPLKESARKVAFDDVSKE